MDRREFLKRSLAAAGGLALGGIWPRLAKAEEEPSRVSLVRNSALAEADDDTANRLLRSMTLVAIADAVGAPDAGSAMRKLFKPDDIVGIKLNCIAPQMAPCPAVVYAVVEALGYAGVQRTNMIIFDKEDRDLAAAGYTCTATARWSSARWGRPGTRGTRPVSRKRVTLLSASARSSPASAPP